MELIKKIKDSYVNSSIKKLKKTIYLVTIVIISISEIAFYYVHQWNIPELVIDWLIGFIIAVIVIEFSFRIILRKERELTERIEQLSDSYEYIGLINRKIHTLLDIKHPFHESKIHTDDDLRFHALQLLDSLVTLIGADYGYISIHNNGLQIKTGSTKMSEELVNKKLFQKIDVLNVDKSIYTNNPLDKTFLAENGIDEKYYNNFDIIAKPVYFAGKNIGHLYLVIPLDTPLDAVDQKAINLFSFYFSFLFYTPHNLKGN